MMANVARLAKDMGEAKRMVGGAMGEIERTVGNAKRALGSLGMGIGFAATIAGIKGIVDSASKLDDISEKTGAAVSELSKYEQVARIGGHSTEVFESALIRMSKALHAQDDEAKGAGKALAALGLSQDRLRGMDTAEALRTVAVELNKYADGGGKSALAIDLLGKSGAQALPFLKDLATEQGISARVTAEQAAAAEEAQKQIGRLKNEMHGVAQTIALSGVPAFTEWIAANRKAIEIAGSFGGALRLFVFNLDAMTTEKPGEQIRRMTAELEKLKGVMAGPWQWQGYAQFFGGEQSIKDKEKQIEFLKYLQRQEALAIPGGDTRGEMQRFGLAGAKLPQLDYKATASNDAAKQAIALLEKYNVKLHQVQEEIRKAEGVDSPFLAMKSLIANDKDFKRLGDEKKKALLDAAELLGLTKSLRLEEAERAEGLAEVARESAAWRSKDISDLNAMKLRYMDLADPIQKYRVQLAEIARLQEAFPELSSVWTEAAFNINLAIDAAAGFNKEIVKTDGIAKDFGHAISTSFEDAVLEGKKLDDVLKALGINIAKIMFRKSVTKPLEDAIGGIDIAALFKGLLGSGTQAPAPVVDAVPKMIAAAAAEEAAAAAFAASVTSSGALFNAEVAAAGAAFIPEITAAGAVFTTEMTTAGALFGAEISAAGALFAAEVAAAGAVSSGGGAIGGIASLFSLFAANGAAFDKAGMVPFASGGIVNSPTRFRFADGGAMRHGLMGEAGPEAILPLKRINGQLGVASDGGGGEINIVINQDNRGVDASVVARIERANAQLRRDIVPIVADATRRGGGPRKAIRG